MKSPAERFGVSFVKQVYQKKNLENSSFNVNQESESKKDLAIIKHNARKPFIFLLLIRTYNELKD